MTTNAKLYISSFTASAMMMLNVFSKPLHIPEPFQWVLMIGVFVPLGLVFYFLKVQKREKALASDSGAMVNDATTEQRKKVKQRLVLAM